MRGIFLEVNSGSDSKESENNRERKLDVNPTRIPTAPRVISRDPTRMSGNGLNS